MRIMRRKFSRNGRATNPPPNNTQPNPTMNTQPNPQPNPAPATFIAIILCLLIVLAARWGRKTQ